MILGTAPVEGRISGIVDIPNACCTLAIPTEIFDFDIRPNASGPKHSVPAGIDASAHSYTVTATDAAGNVSQPSAALSFVVDTDTGEQAALKLTVTTTIISAATATSAAFTIAGMQSEDTGTVTFTDVNGKTVQVSVKGTQTNYTANLSSLADGTVARNARGEGHRVAKPS